MNNKGFTLVELLAVIVILSVLGGIATYGVINAINASKDKAEDAFLNEIGKQVEMYIDLNSFKKSGEGISFSKVISNNISDDGKTGSKVTRDITGWEMVSDGRRLNLNDLITAGYMERDDIKNPNTNEKCDLNNEVIVYMDSDFVYYYYVDFGQKSL